VHAQLLEARTPARRLEVLEAALAARLQQARTLHPAVAMALARFAKAPGALGTVRDAVVESGYSHRRFITLFRRAVGLGPKEYGRVLRFQAALARAATPGASWADIAAAAGYSDQSHLHRDFLALAGVSPGEYRSLAPASPHHVPIAASPAPARSIPSKTPDARARHPHRARRKP
jgi:AraC-like DNA-binding protein